MKESEYRPRIIDRQVDEYLSTFGAVCIEGPKWCGKTWTSAFHSKAELHRIWNVDNGLITLNKTSGIRYLSGFPTAAATAV